MRLVDTHAHAICLQTHPYFVSLLANTKQEAFHWASLTSKLGDLQREGCDADATRHPHTNVNYFFYYYLLFLRRGAEVSGGSFNAHDRRHEVEIFIFNPARAAHHQNIFTQFHNTLKHSNPNEQSFYFIYCVRLTNISLDCDECGKCECAVWSNASP
jgi:hypothetical protein